MDKVYKVFTVILVALVLFFLFFWVFSISSCASPAKNYIQYQHPGCKIVPKVETRTYSVFQVECPGKPPFVKKVRANVR